MDRIFRYRAGLRNTGWAGLMFFPVMMVLSIFVAFDAPADRRWLLPLFFESFWFCLTGGAVWMLLDYYRASLSVCGDRIIKHGVRRAQKIHLNDVWELKWRANDRVVLKSNDVCMVIDFGNFELGERIALIRMLRAAVPESVQHDWPMFCHRWAAPLLDRNEDRELREGEVRVTRAQFDRTFFVIVVVYATVVGWIAWQYQFPRALFGLLAPIPMWFLRFTTPRKGYIARNFKNQTPNEMREARMLLFMLVWGTVDIAVVLWIFPHSGIAATIFAACMMIVLLVRVGIADRQRQRREQAKSPASVLRWEAAASREN